MPPRRGTENAGRGACDAPVLVLLATAGPCKGALFDEQVERRRIGRGPKGNTVCLKDASVSQRHAEVVWTGGEWTLTDVGSSNGTLLNGEEQREGAPTRNAAAASRRAPRSHGAACRRAGEPHALKDGDVITLGDSTVLKVSLRAAPAAGAAATPAPAPLGAAAAVPTVEAFLNAQCEQAVARLRGQLEADMQALRAETEAAVTELLAEAEA